jgi:cyclopropane fatty-acyl-phospholipid synthase-like methyltransferase
MKAFDRYLQRRRYTIAATALNPGSSLLDIGCGDCGFFNYLVSKGITGTGVDPDPENSPDSLPSGVSFIRTEFPAESLKGSQFDYVSALAVLEHVPAGSQHRFAAACHDLLADDGWLLITVPSAAVDFILDVLRFFRLIDGMQLEQHYGFKTKDIVPLFSNSGFGLRSHKRFEFGLNNFYIFEKLNHEK